MQGTEIIRHTGGGNGAAITRTDFEGTELAPIVETSATSVAATAEAKVKARSIVALQRPRDMDLVRVKLLKESKRPGFAAVARYSIPRGGKKIEGPSIRFAEAAARALGNLEISVDVIYDDREKRVLRVEAADLESNHTESLPVVIEKVVERRDKKPGDEVVGVRQNSTGQMVYRIVAPEGELVVKQAALTSKARRNLILSHLPGDIRDECMAEVIATMESADKRDPDAERKKMADAFASIGVMPDDLRRFLGCDLGAAAPAQITDLRAIYSAIRDGEATWAEVAASREGGEAKPAGKVEQLRDRLGAKAKAARSKDAPDSTALDEQPPREPGADDA